MKNDVKSNYLLSIVLRGATVGGSSSVDHAKASSVSFMLDVASNANNSTVDMKTQYSDDDLVWTDYPSQDQAKNDDAIIQIAAGLTVSAQLNIPNPRGRYSRVFVATSGACILSVSSVMGPLRHISP